jgi:hypothetical protein
MMAWVWVALREAIPLSVILLTILIIRGLPSLPEQIPVGWDLLDRAPVWRDRDAALTLLRHRTMAVYIVIFGLEGAYLLVRWARGRHGDIGRRMLSRNHWLYFLFKVGFVLLFAGFNLGCIDYAMNGPLLPYLVPGMFALAALGILVTIDVRRPSRSPSPPGREA